MAGKMADDLGLDETFRLVVNNGAKAGQSVFHPAFTLTFRKAS
jgi:Diadenosine tetraphosphate (Ap4A) hydrolase and other HIT family hydrolases